MPAKRKETDEYPELRALLTDPGLWRAAAEALRERLGHTGRESVTQKFAPDTMVDTIERVYRELICD